MKNIYLNGNIIKYAINSSFIKNKLKSAVLSKMCFIVGRIKCSVRSAASDAKIDLKHGVLKPKTERDIISLFDS